ncbi:hypothetical protein [Bacillus sp. FJAT-29937]|uniref:hypothetical protein n=1 Tax=Bacillus sp. FJAT-29937 TaxID=1720553 RepID=UPI00082E59EE|nr:hypothetical protein [Bacillus sp. FJAT-29937]
MNTEQQELMKFLEQQLEWSKDRSKILDAINDKLHEMKEIAEFSLTHNLSLNEIHKLNEQLNTLKDEVKHLEKQLNTVVH